MLLFVNELMEYQFKELNENDFSISSLDGMLKRLTPNPTYSIVVSVAFDLITIMYDNIYSSIDSISDDI